jgi:putative ABC transport system permease protein
MLKNYFKIFLKVASQNKLFTFLSLFGISLTIMFVMIFSMTISKITSGSGPESDLKKMIFSERIKTRTTHNGVPGSGISTGGCGRTLCADHLKHVKSADVITMYTYNQWEFIFNGQHQLKNATPTDAQYWQVFSYKFLQGRPYTDEDVVKKANLAVITESLKELLFGTDENVLGKTVRYTSMDLVVTGVVEDPPATDQNARGDLYFPYTILSNHEGDDIFIGGYKIAFKARSSNQFPAIRNEVQDIISRLDAADTTHTVFLSGPYSQLEKMMVGYGDPEEFSLGSSLFKYLLIALAFILLPAVNLMALNFARIHERGEEIAVRKSFGAPSAVLRGQFLFENILMTLSGGVLGIILSYLVVALLGSSISLRLSFWNNVPLTFSFNILVFAAALAACLLFGLMSGYLPAIRLSRMKPAIYLKGGEV